MAGPRVITHSVRVLGANPENVLRCLFGAQIIHDNVRGGNHGKQPRDVQFFSVRSASLARFGVAGGAAVLFIAECLPPAKTDLFCKLPVIGSYWKAYEAKDEE
ncbi:hypothetical protein BGZ75_001626 [Mortierella antarctica]|nr:hypothetical protein BGZ75_001626 [Mortierella antarctica]